MKVTILGAETFMPEKIRQNDFFTNYSSSESNPMFRGTKERRHCSREDKGSQFLEKASEKLLEKYNIKAEEIDLFLSNFTMLDIPFTGTGAAWAYTLGASPSHICDIHNSGCTSFVLMLDLAKTLMKSLGLKYALIGNVQTSAGKIFAHPQNAGKPQSVVPGDGCGVALIEASEAHNENSGEIIEAAIANHGEFAEDMFIEKGNNLYWWEPSEDIGSIEFNKSRIMKIISRGNKTVPERIKEVCLKADKKISDIDFLITNQPNPVFLRNWREFVQLPENKMYHSFSKYGNLFGAAIPVNLSEALDKQLIKKGDLLCIAGFSHAGDYSSAALIQY